MTLFPIETRDRVQLDAASFATDTQRRRFDAWRQQQGAHAHAVERLAEHEGGAPAHALELPSVRQLVLAQVRRNTAR